MSDTVPLSTGFLDRLGDRARVADTESGEVDVLRLRPDLTANPLFEFAAKRRVDQLADFLHPNCARVRQVGRLPAPDGRLVVVSEAIDGWRLSEVLEAIDRSAVAFHGDAVLFLVRQLLDAVSALHATGQGVSHGALGTERLIVTPEGRLVVTDLVLGAALRYLPSMPADRLWRNLRLAVADGEAQPFGRLTDLRQVGVIALSLVLGRQVRRDEYPMRLAGLLPGAASAEEGSREIGTLLRPWLARLLSLTEDLTPWSVSDAQRELSRIVAADGGFSFAPTGLAALLEKVADYYAAAADDEEMDEHLETAARPAGPVLVHRPDVAIVLEQPPVEEPAPAIVQELPAERRAVSLSADIDAAGPPEVTEEPVLVCEIPELPGAVEDQPAIDPTVADLQTSLSPLAIFVAELQAPDEPSSPVPARPVAAAPSPDAPRAADLPGASVAPLAETIVVEPTATALDRRDDGRQPWPVASRSSALHPMFGVDPADVETASPAARSRPAAIAIGIGVAATLILALGGFALFRPSAVTATSDRPEASAAAMPSAGQTPSSPVTGRVPLAPSRGDAGTAAAPSRPSADVKPPAAPETAPQAGTLEVVSPVPLKVTENGQVLGVSGESIKIAAGLHSVGVGSEELGYHIVQAVDVKAGGVSRVEPALPSGAANLNATPWAEVWIDGQKVGETPLGRLPLTIGSHQVQFRHPELGDRTRTLVVTTGAVARLSVDLRK